MIGGMVSTGIAGLDALLLGGHPEKNVVVVKGRLERERRFSV